MEWKITVASTGTAQAPEGAADPCVMCLGQRAIFEPSILGLVPVVCDGCAGTGRRRSRR